MGHKLRFTNLDLSVARNTSYFVLGLRLTTNVVHAIGSTNLVMSSLAHFSRRLLPLLSCFCLLFLQYLNCIFSQFSSFLHQKTTYFQRHPLPSMAFFVCFNPWYLSVAVICTILREFAHAPQDTAYVLRITLNSQIYISIYSSITLILWCIPNLGLMEAILSASLTSTCILLVPVSLHFELVLTVEEFATIIFQLLLSMDSFSC